MNLSAIYIPTLGRLERQVTWDSLPDKWKEITHLVVRPHEFEQAKKICPNALCLPDTIQGLHDTRKWIVDYAGNSRYAMFDDDITLWRRHCDRKTLKKNAEKSNTLFTDEDFDELFERVLPRWFSDGVAVGGMNYKGKPPANKAEVDFGKICNAFFINGEKLPNDLDWSVRYCEDLHFVLQVLRSGGKTRITDDFLHKAEYYTEGGCQIDGHRTSDAELDSFNKLISLHKEYVEIKDTFLVNVGVHKNSPMQSVRVKVDWRKAYESSLNKWDNFL